MHHHKRQFLARLLGVGGAIALAGQAQGARAPAPAAQRYRVVNLGPADTGIVINARAQLAFTQADPWQNLMQAWFYDGARLHPLGTLGGDAVRTTGLNDAGQVTGISSTPSGAIHAFVWSRQRGMQDIGVLPGYAGSWEPSINKRGEVAGYAAADPSPPYPRAFRWSAHGGIEQLGVLRDGDAASSYAWAINEQGLIAGTSWAGEANYHAFLWQRGVGMQDIDSPESRYSAPVAISAGGMVAGNRLNPADNQSRVFWWTSQTGVRETGIGAGDGASMNYMSSGGRIAGGITFPDFSLHAMTWTRAQGLLDLGTLGGSSSFAFGANNLDQVVGASVDASDTRYLAFAWNRREGMHDLNGRLVRPPVGLVLESAVGIADNGAVVVSSDAGLVLLQPLVSGRCAHTVGAIVGPNLVPVGAALETAVNVRSDDMTGTLAVDWQWGDGSAVQRVAARLEGGQARARARHHFAAPGIYAVTATVTDRTGHAVQVQRRFVAHASGSGVVAGSAQLLLAPGAGRGGQRAGALARVAFQAAGRQGQFLLVSPSLVFASSDMHAIARQGQQVVLAGEGRVNGQAGYQCRATALASGDGALLELDLSTEARAQAAAAPVLQQRSPSASAQQAGSRASTRAVLGQLIVT